MKRPLGLLPGTVPVISGTIGESKTIVDLLSTFIQGSHFRNVFQQPELFEAIRGTDIGLDFILRLHVPVKRKRKLSVFLGFQVKYHKAWKKIRDKGLQADLLKDSSRLRFLETFPGPVLLLLYIDNLRKVAIDNWLAININSAYRKKFVGSQPIEIDHDGKYFREIGERVIDECANYVTTALSPEKYLLTHDFSSAGLIVEVLKKLTRGDDKIQLLWNRVMIRWARWLPQLYEDMKNTLEKETKQLKEREPCPSYDGYCIHYQAALIRDEALRSRKWVGRSYIAIRKELCEALKALLSPHVRHHKKEKRRLYRYGLGVVALLIMLDLGETPAAWRGRLGTWQELESDLREKVGSELEKSVSKQDALSFELGKIYRSFVDLAIGRTLSRAYIKLWLEERLKGLDNRENQNRDSDENAVVHFLCAGLWIKAGDLEAASTQAERAYAIARGQKQPLWTHPIDYLRGRIEDLYKAAQRSAG